jgi:anti-sigma regulatory factor (Ser/Thr protein kinase)
MDTARLELPATPAAASVARLFVRCLCEEWGVGSVADVAELLSSELVTNAVVHARSAIELEAARTQSDLRVDVRDVGPGTVEAEARPPSSEAEGGRGLAIVASLADSWGVESTGRGKSVWFTLETPSESAGGAPAGGSTDLRERSSSRAVPSDA